MLRLERKKPLSEGVVKVLLHMLLEGVSFLHKHAVVHRDLKPPNLLVEPRLESSWKYKLSNEVSFFFTLHWAQSARQLQQAEDGCSGELKVADFGSARCDSSDDQFIEAAWAAGTLCACNGNWTVFHGLDVVFVLLIPQRSGRLPTNSGSAFVWSQLGTWSLENITSMFRKFRHMIAQVFWPYSDYITFEDTQCSSGPTLS